MVNGINVNRLLENSKRSDVKGYNIYTSGLGSFERQPVHMKKWDEPSFGLAGCADSAYDIAVKNGFTGTEQEWLQSLQGADGQDAPKLTVHDVYEEAVASGEFGGSFSDFLESYLALSVPENNNVEILAKNVLSTVSIYTGFETTETGLLGQVVSK